MRADGKTATWIYRYRVPGGFTRQTELRFGTAPAMSLARARAIRADVHPTRLTGQTSTLAGDASAGLTVGGFVDLYLTEYSLKARAPISVIALKRLLAQLQVTHGLGAVSAFGPCHASASLRYRIKRGALVDAARMRAVARAMWNIGIPGVVQDRPRPAGGCRP
jgi:hypothetical protein